MQQISVGMGEFIPADSVQYGLFEDNTRKDKFRQTLHAVKARFGNQSLVRATELHNGHNAPKDLIGFGSIKDLHEVQLVDIQLDSPKSTPA